MEGVILRLIYLDEAGTSPKEPVRVVAGIIVEADNQLEVLEKELDNIYANFVPKKYRISFQFHAVELYSGRLKLKGHKKSIEVKDWLLPDRIDLLKAVISLPRSLNAPICFASVFSKAALVPSTLPGGLTLPDLEHMEAFGGCLRRADHYIKTRLEYLEKGTVIAEETQQMQKNLNLMFEILKNSGNVNFDIMMRDSKNKTDFLGSFTAGTTCLINQPQFLKKGVAPMLDVADGVAYAIRRWVSKNRDYEDLLYCMFGEDYSDHVLGQTEWTTGPYSESLVDHLANEMKVKFGGGFSHSKSC